mgnify:CR=1 FL=1
MKTLIEALADAVENNGNINAKVLKAIKSVIAAFDALPAPVVPEGFVLVDREDLTEVLKGFSGGAYGRLRAAIESLKGR